MTLAELAKMRKIRAVPAYPIVLTASEDVYKASVEMGLPVMWTPGFGEQEDLKPLHGIPLWLIDTPAELNEKIRDVEPRSMWVTGRFGFQDKVNGLVGMDVLTWN